MISAADKEQNFNERMDIVTRQIELYAIEVKLKLLDYPLFQQKMQEILDEFEGSKYSNPLYCAALLALHEVALQENLIDEAEKHILEITAIVRFVFKPTDRELLGGVTRLGLFYYKQGEWDKALPAFEEALTLLTSVEGLDARTIQEHREAINLIINNLLIKAKPSND
jgi:tetratricopeptide (TPR) repeat protein